MAIFENKFFGPAPHAHPGSLGTVAKYARQGPDFGENMKKAIYGQVMQSKLNYLEIKCLEDKKFFCEQTDLHQAHLGAAQWVAGES